MTKIALKKPAFSLAEALITLLVVCLITVASIPVLTKKKRDQSRSGPTGMWMCTRNNDGKYVSWNSTNPVGDKDNPETWMLSQNGEGCTFIPPQSTKNFGLTLIGGGGGGGNGSAGQDKLAKVESGERKTFTPEKTDMYDVIVIGAGGGGGNYTGDAKVKHTGGGGAGGGMFFGTIPLFAGTTYELKAGSGGAIGHGYYNPLQVKLSKRKQGSQGGSSHLTYMSGSDTRTQIVAHGGDGGDTFACVMTKLCIGGFIPANGGITEILGRYNELTMNGITRKSDFNSTRGVSGGAATNEYCAENNGGKNYYYDASGSLSGYGDGGNGGNICKKEFAKLGNPGYVSISKTWRHFGTGGSSAVPTTYFLGSINGKLNVSIADKASPEKQGGTTVVTIIKDGKVGRKFSGFGGAGGVSSENIQSPQDGAHSQYTFIGGGAAAPECTPRKRTAYEEGDELPKVAKCKKVKCVINTDGEYNDINKLKKVLNNNFTSGGTQRVPKGFVKSSYYDNNYVPKHIQNGPEDNTIEPYEYDAYYWKNDAPKLYDYLEGHLGIGLYVNNTWPPFRSSTYSTEVSSTVKALLPEYNLDDEYKKEFLHYQNGEDVYNYRCYRDENLYYEKYCAEEELVDADVRTTGIFRRKKYVIEPGKCEVAGGDATSFGAGGGGGNAGDNAGIFSKGGKGAYGAVIIEW